MARVPQIPPPGRGSFFSIITRQAIRRSSFTSVKGLITAIENFIEGRNDRCRPFTWTKGGQRVTDPRTGGLQG